MPDTNEALDVSGCYVADENRVLDPSLVDKELIERLPQPTGWRILSLRDPKFGGRPRASWMPLPVPSAPAAPWPVCPVT